MAALIPVTQPTNVEAYEDMFKEITRKLYGEETGNGLHTLGTPVAQIVSSGPTAPEGEERSFTTLMSDRNLAPTIEYEQHQEASATGNNNNNSNNNNNNNSNNNNNNSNNFKPDEHLTTAFGLAALMQNGFATNATMLPKSNNSATNSTITSASNSASNINNISSNNSGNVVGNTHQQQQQQQPRWNNTNDEVLPWTAENKLANFNVTNKPNKSSSGRKNKNPNSSQITNASNSQQQPQQQQQKRYSCTHCPYSTDRRDLYTRHENIHKDEKPFQCYACLKQFNRADHVKKHFLRMHRELSYDINKTRRNINCDQKPTNLFNRQSNNNNSSNQAQQVADNFLNPIAQRTVQQQEAISLSIVQTIESVATAQVNSASSSSNISGQTAQQLPIQMKQEKTSPDERTVTKIKREKRFTCCYCPWSGADKWGLKRHLNTHTKPFVCMLCDYKAARSERLATHVLKVHNKKACNKCSFLADSQEDFQTHFNEVHPHDNRTSRSTNSNVLRTIGNTLVSNNQINNFQNQNSFGIPTTNNGVSAIYANNDLTNNTNNTSNNSSGNLQDLIANPASMIGWRLSAGGSLIPPSHLNEPGNPNQKRGAERLFQYLEADGSDPEDYSRQLKMDAISRNTASVAQDFHNAGGVVCNNNNYNNILNLSTSKYSREAAHFQENQENNNIVSDIRKITIDNKTSESTMNKVINNCYTNNVITIDNSNDSHQNELENRKAMSNFLLEQQLSNKSPPAFLINQLTKQNQIDSTITSQSTNKGHRLDSDFNKENKHFIYDNMNSENIFKLNIQIHNYIKDIINKYYAEPQIQQQIQQNNANLNQKIISKTETENYIEYLKSKDDITLIVTSSTKKPKQQQNQSNQLFKNTQNIFPFTQYEKRNRKQSQPKRVLTSNGPELSIARLREKYLKRLVVDRKKSCTTCINNKSLKSHMLVFPYHTVSSLVLHRFWKHSEKLLKCQKCSIRFLKTYSLKIHLKSKHNRKKFIM